MKAPRWLNCHKLSRGASPWVRGSARYLLLAGHTLPLLTACVSGSHTPRPKAGSGSTTSNAPYTAPSTTVTALAHSKTAPPPSVVKAPERDGLASAARSDSSSSTTDSTGAATPLEPLPPSVRPGTWSHVVVPGYRRAYVVHADAEARTALLYLHGVCGDVEKIKDWAFAASERVTTVALLGDRLCEGTTRFKWSQDIELIHQLAQRALQEVQRVRGGLLETDEVLVFGYSQGATRAELLAQRYPERYGRVILGGSPRAPNLERLGEARAVAIFGGELENRDHLVAGHEQLQAAGVSTRLDVLPGVGHGAFGPHSPQLVTQLVEWLQAH